MNAIVILGTGFEEIEALAVVDILRRAGMTVQTAGIGGTMVTGSHGIAVRADLPIEAVAAPELLVLPGGLGGVQAMEGSAAAMALIERQMASDRPLGAICAAPSILGKRGRPAQPVPSRWRWWSASAARRPANASRRSWSGQSETRRNRTD